MPATKPKPTRPRQRAFRFTTETNALLDRLAAHFQPSPTVTAIVEMAIREMAERRLGISGKPSPKP
jgi:hypothetical protein